jgi:hypothetical protein
MKSGWKEHKGKRYFFCDYSGFGLDFQSLKTEVNAVDDFISQEPENSVITLIDFRNTVGSVEAVDLFKQGASRTRKNIRKNAILGISGVRTILLDAVTRLTGQVAQTFEDEEKAKDWLVS